MSASDAARVRETMTVEIPGSPLSRHDLEVIRRQVTFVRAQGREVEEIVVSSRRLTQQGLRVLGIPVRLNDEFDLNEGALVVDDSLGPVAFDFEADRG